MAHVCLLVQAWFPDPVSTLGADEVFRHMRSAEGVTTKNGDTSPIQLQSMAIKALSGLYENWVFPKIGVPQNGWFIRENPIKTDDLGDTAPPIFGSTPKWPL